MNPNSGQVRKKKNRNIESDSFSKIPPDLFTHILKHLSPDDLVSCSLVCSRNMDHACSGQTCSYYQIGDVFVCEM
ncbi:hypothetical protein V6N13_063965 [Hibiscus sabdariffa]|uniref:F-box domain-containing protein n=2 Tax=Hibiscus sabdariffa TaxID=183260 RepID=A0ABR2R1N7_9ROSI